MDTINVRLDRQGKPIEVVKDSSTSVIRAFPDLDIIIDYVFSNHWNELSGVLEEHGELDSNSIKELLLSENESLVNLGINILSEFLNVYDDNNDGDGIQLPAGIGNCLEIYQFILLDGKEKTKWLLLNWMIRESQKQF